MHGFFFQMGLSNDVPGKNIAVYITTKSFKNKNLKPEQ